jgi:hypothetical protein
MIVRFRTKAHADILMFGDVAIQLLKLAGHSGTVPSAILAADVRGVIERLEAGLAHLKATADAADPRADAKGAEQERNRDDPEAEPPIPLERRALPLLQLLRAADKAAADVLIETNA